MRKLYSGRIFADHNQFFLLDGNLDYREFLDHWRSDSSKLGYIAINGGIAVITVGGFWVHWIEVYFSEIPPFLEDCERALVLNINIHTEKFSITAPACCDEVYISVSPGHYAVYILAYNLGKESEEVLEDDELERRTDLERYKIVLVPGKTDNEGVIKGCKFLPDCVFDEE